MIERDGAGQSARVSLEGDLDIQAVETLREQLRGLVLEEDVRRLTLNFENTLFMCSNGLGLLVEIHKMLATMGGSIQVENLKPPIEKLLVFTKLLPMFTGPDTNETHLEALEAVHEHMSEENRFLSYINTISSNLLRSATSDRIYPQALDAIIRILKPQRALLLLLETLEPDGLAFHVAASHAFKTDAKDAVEGLQLVEQSLEGQCLSERQARLFTALNRGQVVSPLLQATDSQEGILEPIVGANRPLGLLLLEEGPESPPFFSQSAPPLQVFTNICGLAAEKQQLLEDISAKNKELSQTLAELQRTQNSLMEAGKLAAMSAMGRGLSHSLNNKLVPIIGYAQMLGLQLSKDSKEGQKIRHIEKSALSIQDIIHKMRHITQQRLQFREQDLRDILESCLRMLDYLFREENINVCRQYRGAETRAEVHRESVVQAFLALFHRLPRAFAGKEEKTLTIDMGREDDHMLIIMTDNGRRLPQVDLDSFQRPFDYAEELNEDRFNFNITRSVMKDHKGSLTLESTEEMDGTRVTLSFPLKRESEEIVFS